MKEAEESRQSGLPLAGASTPERALEEVDVTKWYPGYLGLSDLIAKQDLSPGPLRGRERLGQLHLPKVHIYHKSHILSHLYYTYSTYIPCMEEMPEQLQI